MNKRSKMIRKEKSVDRGYIKIEKLILRLFRVYTADGRAHGKGSCGGRKEPVEK